MAFPLSDAEHVAIRERIDSQEELIVAAAIRWGRVVVVAERPGRHADCIWPLHRAGADHSEQGFMTNRGRFVDRKEAAQIVAATAQGSTRDFGEAYPRSLFSEDMWNDTDTELADAARQGVTADHAELGPGRPNHNV